MKSKINVVVLTPGFAADESDSAALPYLQSFLKKLHSFNNEVNIHIVSFYYPFLNRNYIWNGIQVYAAGGTSKKYLKIFLWIRILNYLFRLRKGNKIDIIHSFWLTETTLIGLIFRLFTGVPIISTAMGQDIKKQNRYLWFIRFFKFDLVTLSDFQATFLRGIFKTNLRQVIPFGIDMTYFRQKGVERTIDIIAVGSLNKIKNYSQFTEIVSSIVKDFPGLICGIVGEGNEKENIEKTILKYGLEKQIILFGQLAYENVIEKMEESKILLHTSEFEGQSLVITEALAAGAYIVCYPVGIVWNKKIKKVRTGLTMKDLEQHIRDILSEEKPDYSQEILALNDETCSEYVKIYQNIVAARYYDNLR
jgi:1,2-diacylglycerol 3-alpha-glucosyltransferase